jgi:hypothetical protein
MSKNNDNNLPDDESGEFNSDPNSFGLPEGYFDHSAQSILNKIEWLEEHKAYENLTKLKGMSGFITPENYFEKSEAQLELLDFPTLLSISKRSPFTVPENYFEDAEVKEMMKVMKEEESELAGFEILSKVEKKNGFTVKENYFESTETKLKEELGTGAKFISLFRAHVWYSSAAAALVIVLGVWLYSNYFKPVEKDCTSLACIDKSELLKQKNIENVDADELFDMVDAKKLEQTLDKKEDPKEKKDSLNGVDVDDLPDDI